MKSLVILNSSEATISAAIALVYTTTHPLHVSSSTAALKQINEQ
ncbi:hypothetical protein [Chitinophaga silvisoli]|nr:hypothetical protein [Chitinophaga silvisoli]